MKLSFRIELELSRSNVERIDTTGSILPNGRMAGFRWKKIRATIRERDNGICQYCKFPASDGTVDHIMPISRGGSDKPDNLVWSCKLCNSSKGDSTPQEWQQRIGQQGQESIEDSPNLVKDEDVSLSDVIRFERVQEQVRQLVKDKTSSSQIIQKIWGVTSGSQYIKASQELTAIMASIVS